MGLHPFDFDLVVIGGGTAGLTASQAGVALGLRTALIERDRTGGECLYRGCVPSKALLTAAGRVHASRSAAEFGLPAPDAPADWPSVQAYFRGVIAGIAPNDDPAALERAGVQVIAGQATFTAERTVEVTGQGGETRLVRGRIFVLATGSEPKVPEITGLADTPYLTADTLWDELHQLPEHLAILGGGAIACELGQAFRRLGARVTLLEAAPRLLGDHEPEAGDFLHARLVQEGATVRLSAHVERVEHGPDGFRLHTAGGPPLSASHLLVAVGRRPRLAGLGLETIGAEHDGRGLKLDATLRSTTCPWLAGAGDAVGAPYLTHAAFERAFVALLGLRSLTRPLARWRAPVLDALPAVVFSDPEIARWGLTERAARARYGAGVTVIDYDLSQLDRARTDGETGLIKLVLRSGMAGTPLGARLVGAQVVGPRAGELIQLLTLPGALHRHPARLALVPAPYPTYGEAAKYALAGLLTQGHLFGRKR